MNWPDFAASQARLGWPAHNRHTVACMHRSSHILRWPPEPAVWLMSELGAVAGEQAMIWADLPIISSSFEMTLRVSKGHFAIIPPSHPAKHLQSAIIIIFSLSSKSNVKIKTNRIDYVYNRRNRQGDYKGIGCGWSRSHRVVENFKKSAIAREWSMHDHVWKQTLVVYFFSFTEITV